MTKTAVVLFNLGGPDRPEAVRQMARSLADWGRKYEDPLAVGLGGFAMGAN